MELLDYLISVYEPDPDVWIKFKERLPPEFWNLVNLQYLDPRGNQLLFLPPELKKFR